MRGAQAERSRPGAGLFLALLVCAAVGVSLGLTTCHCRVITLGGGGAMNSRAFGFPCHVGASL